LNGNGTFLDHDKESTESGYESWITRVWATALKEVGMAHQRPYDLRTAF
jgi:hypothetical protein